MTVERDGPLLRYTGFETGGFVGYRDLDGLDGADLDELIARQVELFGKRGEEFEWKLHAHDQPPDLADRLVAAGFVPQDLETVVVAPLDAVPLDAAPPPGVTLRETRERSDLVRIATMQEAVWGEDHSAFVDDLERELEADPDGLVVVLAEAGDAVVSAAWVRFPEATEFGTLWGGATLPAWRGRGIYRSLVAHRGRLAAAQGRRYLQVDASPDSRPILERLGFVAVTTTTPYVWSP